MRRNIRFAGAGGQGVILSSVLLAKAYGLGEGYNISQTQSYGPEARGGACKAELVVSDQEIDYMKVDVADWFIAYNQEGYNKYCKSVRNDAKILINSTLVETDASNHYSVPATEIAEEMGMPVAVNIVMLGALTKLLDDLDFETMEVEIVKNFDEKFKVANIKAFEKGYMYMEDILDIESDDKTSKNIMVCVTKQRTCDRLITYGREILGNWDGELFVIHVSQKGFKDMGSDTEAEALDYLYEKALEYDTNLTVVRSNNVVEILTNLVVKNNIDVVVMGESHKVNKEDRIVDRLKESLDGAAKVKTIPS